MTDVFRGIEAVPAGFGASVAAIGNFDGVHRGHQQILGAVVREARERGARAVAVTFDPHPERFLRRASAPALLTPMAHRLELLAATGVDAVLVLRFDERLARLSAREFVEQVLANALQLRGLHEGGNFRFGYKAEAGVRELAAFGAEFGFGLTVHAPVRVHGLEVSSSAIRALVAAGDMKRARWMLGRPFAVRSTQKRDRGVGSKLLVPTINFAEYEGLLPAFGIYVTRLGIAGRCFQAVSSLGIRPTFADAGFALETHILNFEPIAVDANTPMELEFLYRLRDEEKYPDVASLKAQILRDVAKAQRYFRLVR
ncbi:bifunctional riboflavin kinase/FAD synthetase [Acidobacteria bacterium AB60]|nr:bifunctional riboflavin kinase/FAD synthetase [Acidobacteria bacterium AB60]